MQDREKVQRIKNIIMEYMPTNSPSDEKLEEEATKAFLALAEICYVVTA